MSYIYDLTDTWNAGGTVFTAIKMNVTNSASASGSKVISLQVNGTEQFSVDKDGKGYVAGNFGIGTSSPGAKLDVLGASSDQIRVRTASTEYYRFGRNSSTGYMDFYGSQTGYTGYTFGGVDGERMRIDSSGNVGIGTASPAAKLHIYGASPRPIVEGSGNGNYATWKYISKTSGGATVNFEQGVGIAADNAFELYDNQNAQLVSRYISGGSGYWSWLTNGSERARIDASGNLLVGTTSADGKLTVRYDPASTFGISVQTTSDTSAYAIAFRNAAASIVGSIQTTASVTAYNTSSDARLKENITNADSASSLIDAIQVRQFNWKADGSHQRYGMVAQELLEVAPEAVSVPADEEAMMGVDYSKLVPMMLKEIQSLRARVAQLEGK